MKKELFKIFIYKELKMSLVQFLLAGYETTSTALSYCLFVLSTNPNEMAKLQEEIDAAFDENFVILIILSSVLIFNSLI